MDKIYFDAENNVLYKLEEEIDNNTLKRLYFEMVRKLEEYTKEIGLELKEYPKIIYNYDKLDIIDYEILYVKLFYVMCMYNNQIFKKIIKDHKPIHIEYYKKRYETDYLIYKK